MSASCHERAFAETMSILGKAHNERVFLVTLVRRG